MAQRLLSRAVKGISLSFHNVVMEPSSGEASASADLADRGTAVASVVAATHGGQAGIGSRSRGWRRSCRRSFIAAPTPSPAFAW
jgi:hypothetical protein